MATGGESWRVGNDQLGGKVTVLGEYPALYSYAHLDDWAEGLWAPHRLRARGEDAREP